MHRESLVSSLQRLFFVIALLSSLVTFFYLFENWRGQRAWRQLTQESQAAGDRLDWAAYASRPVPDQDNFMATPLLAGVAYKDQTDPDALAQLEACPLYSYSFDSGRWKNAELIDLLACERYLRDRPAISRDRQEAALVVIQAMADLEPAFAELRTASSRSHAQFRGDSAPDGLMPNLAALRQIAYLLALRTSAELALGRTEEAFADAWVLHRLGWALQNEPHLVGMMSGAALFATTGLQVFWEGLAAGRWSGDQLRQFQAFYASANLLASYDRAMKGGERAALDLLLHKTPATAMIDLFGTGGSSGLAAFAERIYYRSWPRGWLYQNQVFHHRLLQQTAFSVYDLPARRIYPERIGQAADRLDQACRGWNPFARLATVGLPNFIKAIEHVARTQTFLDQAVIVCALERYRQQHGAYPDSLESLQPGLLSSVPPDIIGGQSPRYRPLNPASYELYGVGWDGIDDAGQSEASANSTGDWLWPRPVAR